MLVMVMVVMMGGVEEVVMGVLVMTVMVKGMMRRKWQKRKGDAGRDATTVTSSAWATPVGGYTRILTLKPAQAVRWRRR